MGLFDNLGDIAKVAGDKAANMAETTKLGAQKAQAKGKIELLYKQLGEQVYALYKQGQDVGCPDICRQIDALNETIDEKNEQQASVKERAAAQPQSPQASSFSGGSQAASVNVDMGQPASVNVDVGQPSTVNVDVGGATSNDAVFCTNCGSKVEGGVKFCQECGNKIE